MKFLNRVVEAEEISRLVLSDVSNNKIILVYGTTGVGKSGLVQKLLEDELSSQASIKVKVSKSSIDTIENLQYLNSIYRAVCAAGKKKMFDSIPSVTKQSIFNVKNLLMFSKGVLRSKAGINEETRLYEPEESQDVIRKKDYIISVLKKGIKIVDIENIQNIDTHSLEVLAEILKRVQGITLILEYTIDQENRGRFLQFVNEIKALNGIIHCYPIDKMDFEIAWKLSPENSCTNKSILQQIYDKSQGNLMEIILSNITNLQSDSFISSSVHSLSRDEKYLANVVYLLGCDIDYEELYEIVSSDNYNHKSLLGGSQYQIVIQTLIEKKVIYFKDGKLSITHDSIANEISSQPPNPILFNAYRSTVDYLHKIVVQKPQKRSWGIERLFTLYLKFSDDELLNILDDVKEIILQFKYPQSILSKIDYYKQKALEQKNNGFWGSYQLLLMLTEVCVEKRLMNEAQSNINLIYDPSNYYHLALQAKILSLDCTNKAKIEQLKALIDKSPENSRIRFTMELCMLHAMMKMQPTFITAEYITRLYSNEMYKDFFEYFYLLRNKAELAESNEESLHLYEQCLAMLENSNRVDLRNQIMISLSMIHSYMGNLQEAQEAIEEIFESGDSLAVSSCYVYNNRAAIDILSDHLSADIEKNLNDALLLSVSDYEKAIINCNLLVYYVLSTRMKEAKDVCIQIESCNYFAYKYEELQHILCINLAYYYDKANMPTESNYYKMMIESLICCEKTNPTTKKLAKAMLSHQVLEDIFYSKFPYRVDFLGYWEFEISRELEHYQLAV